MNKIYKDLNESVYVFNHFDLKLYFSSMFYYKKFVNRYNDFIKDEIDKLKIKFKCGIVYVTFSRVLLILLYKKIEKRGFKVLYKGEELNKDFYITIDII